MTSPVHEDLRRHLLAHYSTGSRQEDLCFALWRPSTGRTRSTGLLCRPVLPELNDRELHGNVSVRSEYFERAIGVALEEDCGLAFMHSHPVSGWQAMSQDDVETEQKMASSVFAATGLPLLGMTMGTDGAWSARFWEKTASRQFERRWCASVRTIGEGLTITFMEELAPQPAFRTELRRTISAWGPKAQAQLARIRIGIVGVGSVGDMIAEALARMGIEDVMLIDFDTVELHNLDRLLHARREDVGTLKVDVTAHEIKPHATAANFRVEQIDKAVMEIEGFKAALDCDILFSAVDRPWGRSVLNFIAYVHLIPVIDGGVSVRVSEGNELRGADWKAHTVGPQHRCLECLGQYLPGDVTLESEGFLDDPAYIKGLPKSSHLRRNENVFAFSMGAANLQILQMLSLVIAPSGLSDVGAQSYHMVTGTMDQTFYDGCLETCLYPGLIAAGDACPIQVTGQRK